MAYVSSASKRQMIKDEVLSAISAGASAVMYGREIYRLGSTTVHARYCSSGSGNYYKFNINPNTLRADFELWICGSRDHYYLIPMSVIEDMYKHPTAYPDNHHPKIRVVTVDQYVHSARYASPSITRDLSPYFRATLRVG